MFGRCLLALMLLVSSPALADDQAAKVEKTEKDTAKLEEIAATSTGTEKDVAEAPTTANNVAKEEKQEEKTSQTSGGEQVSHLPEIVVQGRQDSLLGIADSASQGTTGQEQLSDRPILRSGEVLETVPGVMITQHAGGGKANQYFLRGFNLDHGTDFAVFLDNMPLNLPSHAHGEGYSDMNTVISELVERIDWAKGPYSADVGNYGSAGSAHLVFYKHCRKTSSPSELARSATRVLAFGYRKNSARATCFTGAGVS